MFNENFKKMKHKYIKIISFSACMLLLLASCRKLEYYQTNPNSPTDATPALLLTNISISTFSTYPPDPAYSSRHLTYYERPNTSVNYGWGEAGFGNYDVLRQVKKMDELAEKSGAQNYRAVAKFFRAINFIGLTETFGDVPYSDALKALEGTDKPKYDTQEDIYVGVLKELEDANAMIDPAKGLLVGDIIYGGKVDKWKKVINTFRLRVLIHLSKKESNTRLNIKQQFQDIISNPTKYPLMTGIADNFQLVYNKSAINNSYPTFQNLTFSSLVSMEKSFVTILKDRKDPRLFKIAEPVNGKAANVYDNYEGVDGSLTTVNQNTASTNASKQARRYFEDQVNEPLIFIGYAEQEFLIAEAIARNWITAGGTADVHYNAGITASMKFYGVADSSVTRYLTETNVKYDPVNAIPLILTQKYISFFMNSFYEPFFEQRRTGIPVLSVGPGTLNGGKVPKRWRYPQSEYQLNKTNVDEAVKRQYPGGDTVNEVMWLLQ